MRTDLTGYRFDVPNGIYEVELLFADIFQPRKQIAYLLKEEQEKGSAPSGNVFDIQANGIPLEVHMNLGTEMGYFHAMKKRFIISNSIGYIDIRFNPIHGKTFLSGIKLRKL